MSLFVIFFFFLFCFQWNECILLRFVLNNLDNDGLLRDCFRGIINERFVKILSHFHAVSNKELDYKDGKLHPSTYLSELRRDIDDSIHTSTKCSQYEIHLPPLNTFKRETQTARHDWHIPANVFLQLVQLAFLSQNFPNGRALNSR